MDRKFPFNDPRTDYDVPSLKCFHCGANMVRRRFLDVCLSDPPRRRLEWWCRCGVKRLIRFEEIPGSRYEKPAWEREWEEANRGKEVQHA